MDILISVAPGNGNGRLAPEGASMSGCCNWPTSSTVAVPAVVQGNKGIVFLVHPEVLVCWHIWHHSSLCVSWLSFMQSSPLLACQELEQEKGRWRGRGLVMVGILGWSSQRLLIPYLFVFWCFLSDLDLRGPGCLGLFNTFHCLVRRWRNPCCPSQKGDPNDLNDHPSELKWLGMTQVYCTTVSRCLKNSGLKIPCQFSGS